MRPPYKEIKEFYEYLTPHIIQRQAEKLNAWTYPYGNIRWELYFSPIEEQTWMALRCFGKCPMYPQYPALNYFLDFANPYTKVCIECDGKEFHADKEKDELRDKDLYDNHWIVYRISGSHCYKHPPEEYYDLDGLDHSEAINVLRTFYFTTIEGLIQAIAIFHFGYRYFNQEYNELEIALECLNQKMSIKNDRLNRLYDKILYEYDDMIYDN